MREQKRQNARLRQRHAETAARSQRSPSSLPTTTRAAVTRIFQSYSATRLSTRPLRLLQRLSTKRSVDNAHPTESVFIECLS